MMAALLGLAASSPAGAFSVRKMTPREVAEASAIVVVARVELEGVSTTGEGAVVETLRLEVLETWKGAPQRSRSVRQWIGHRTGTGIPGAMTGPSRSRPSVEGTRVQEVAGLPRLRDGQTYLLFLPSQTARPTLPLMVGGVQGAFEAEGKSGEKSDEKSGGKSGEASGEKSGGKSGEASGEWLFRGMDGRRIVGLTDTHLVYERASPAASTSVMRAGEGVRLQPGRPTDPARLAPTYPARLAPTEPGKLAPTHPHELAPTEPGKFAPTHPAGLAPTEPGKLAPTHPHELAPTEPGKLAPTHPAGLAVLWRRLVRGEAP